MSKLDGRLLSKIYVDYVKICKLKGKDPTGEKTFQARVTGKRTAKGNLNPIPYDHLIDIVEAYEVDCLDLFLDFVIRPSVGSIVVVEDGALSTKKLFTPNHGSHLGEISFVEPEALKDNRTKIDSLRLEGGKTTDSRSHVGHEYLFCVKGSLEIQFIDAVGGAKTVRLIEDQAVAFNSMIQHSLTNLNKESECLILVARPTYSNRELQL